MTENESTEAIFKFDEITKKYEKKKKPVIEAVVPSMSSEATVTNANGTELISPKAIQNNPPNTSAIMS